MKTEITRNTGALILIMIILVIVGIFIAKSHYGNITRSIDPRVTKARELYTLYNGYAEEGNYQKLFSLLDSIENVYLACKHYEVSFEVGVVNNNRAAALLTISMFADSISREHNTYFEYSTDSLVSLAEANIRKAISIYTTWLKDYSGKSSEQILRIIEPQFKEGLEDASKDAISGYLDARVSDIEDAIAENNKRLSVCYANLGIVFRQREEYVEAVKHYEKALDLWDRNLDAENNLNRLLGKPLKKRNFIQKLFPPKRNGQ